ncbi:MAG: hypothetical protein HQ521_13880 [Bacteroidetes bacterium]|nr:hypothetical protein [Bacteroidota bacterium]
MKRNLLFAALIILSVFIFSEGCKKDDDSSDDIGLENPNLPGQMMTLSAIAYVADDSVPDTIKHYILDLLSDTSLTTRGNWSLAWGPGITPNNENLVYVATNTTGDSPAFAIAIRGTNVHSIGNILSDVDVFKLVEFSYGKSGDSVSRGSMNDFNSILETKDPDNGSTLEEYLKSINTSTKIPLFVTGHSLGGGLAPLMAYWLITNDGLKDKFLFSTYAFAGPGWVNKSFQDNFLSSLPGDASFRMFVNSLDMIPYGYSNLPGIIGKNIPVKTSSLYRLIIRTAQDSLTSRGIKYYNIVVADTIGNFPVTTNPSGTNLLDSISWYDHWLLVEHNHNNYLKLLGAVPLN